MKLTHCCLVTKDVKRLCEFYKLVFQSDRECGDRYVEFDLEQGILAIASIELENSLAPGLFDGGENRGMVIQFQVEDVEAEFERLEKIGVDWVKPLTTQPWGSRSAWFKDPDGNVIDLFMWVDKPES
ncbi:MAG: VOC family protein [Candidatus Latescibacteria bacterium]|jgi:uncharacterized glyoxalase superfamily protein PhnB|nr:VOC family protein [Candidatus Latescibacterota bacterium]